MKLLKFLVWPLFLPFSLLGKLIRRTADESVSERSGADLPPNVKVNTRRLSFWWASTILCALGIGTWFGVSLTPGLREYGLLLYPSQIATGDSFFISRYYPGGEGDYGTFFISRTPEGSEVAGPLRFSRVENSRLIGGRAGMEIDFRYKRKGGTEFVPVPESKSAEPVVAQKTVTEAVYGAACQFLPLPDPPIDFSKSPAEILAESQARGERYDDLTRRVAKEFPGRPNLPEVELESEEIFSADPAS